MNILFDIVSGSFHIKNFFTEEEYRKMWIELSYLCSDDFLISPNESGGTVERSSRGLPIESVLDSNSDIIDTMDKLFQSEILDEIVNKSPTYEPLRTLKNKTHLINHYMDNQSYGYHKDKCNFTAIAVFHRIPKLYDGGDLTFKLNERIIDISLMPKDLVLFPGSLDHSVSSVKLHEGVSKDNMSGRISVSKFIK
jgi:hypothetical protein